MTKIKLDENLGKRGKEIFQKCGYDIQTVFDEGLCSTPDRNLINKCRKEKRALVTLDLDFANPLAFKPSKYHGLIVIRLRPKPTPNELNDCITMLADKLFDKDVDGKLWIIQKNIIREYQEESTIPPTRGEK